MSQVPPSFLLHKIYILHSSLIYHEDQPKFCWFVLLMPIVVMEFFFVFFFLHSVQIHVSVTLVWKYQNRLPTTDPRRPEERLFQWLGHDEAAYRISEELSVPGRASNNGDTVCVWFPILGLKPSLPFHLVTVNKLESYFLTSRYYLTNIFAVEFNGLPLNPTHLPVRPLIFLSRKVCLYQDPILITKTVKNSEESESLLYM